MPCKLARLMLARAFASEPTTARSHRYFHPGREIFLQMKNISDDSELLEGESEAVEVDESLFEALDDLDLEEDLA